MVIKIAIIAVMAAGKTTVTTALASQRSDIHLIPEPVEKWKSSGLLEKFYKNKKKYALKMQLNAVKTRYEDIREQVESCDDPTKIFLIDGHMLTDRFGFVQTLFEEGNISLAEKEQYEGEFEVLMNDKSQDHELFIYLRCDPATCLKRAKERARSEEVGLQLEYLQHLHDNFQLFSEMPMMKNKIITINATDKTAAEIVKQVDQEIEKFMCKIKNAN